MKTFNNEMPREMRIKEDVKGILTAMFISSEEKKKLLQDRIEDAVKTINIPWLL